MKENYKEINEVAQKQKLERTELLTLLQNFSNLRTGQDQVLWSIIGAFWTTNSVLLVSIFSSDNIKIFYVGIIISIIGISISWIWKNMQKRALLRILYYEKAIETIEKKLNLDFELCIYHHPDSEGNNEKTKNKPARYIMAKFSKYSIVFWVVAEIIFLGLFMYDILK